MKLVPLANSSLTAVVDDEDYQKVSGYRWLLNQNGYVVTWIGPRSRTCLYLHRLIMGFPIRVDHRFHNLLDNRRSALRACCHHENIRNQKTQNRKGKTSKFKGVCWDKARNKWLASIGHWVDGKRKFTYLGRFDDQIDAAKAYNEEALRVYGEFALLNVV